MSFSDERFKSKFTVAVVDALGQVKLAKMVFQNTPSVGTHQHMSMLQCSSDLKNIKNTQLSYPP